MLCFEVVIISVLQGVELGEEHLSKLRSFTFMLLLMDVLKWLVPAAGLLLLCFSSYKYVTTRTGQDVSNITVTYDNRGYVHKPEDINAN